MYFDRFDIVSAWYLALSDCHSGQGSRAYERLSRMCRYFTPGAAMCVLTLNDNAREIYDAACAKLLKE